MVADALADAMLRATTPAAGGDATKLASFARQERERFEARTT
jgi:hypothetical protein